MIKFSHPTEQHINNAMSLHLRPGPCAGTISQPKLHVVVPLMHDPSFEPSQAEEGWTREVRRREVLNGTGSRRLCTTMIAPAGDVGRMGWVSTTSRGVGWAVRCGFDTQGGLP